MKNLLNISAALLLFLAGCAGRPTPIPEMDSKDAALYSARCGPCHSVPHPKRHTAVQWEHMVGVMEKEMRHKKMTPLTAEEKTLILGYLKKHSR